VIYLVEDEKAIRELILYTLNNAGLQAKGFENGSDFRQAAREEVPSLVLLDLMLPGEDGLAILKRLRASGKTASVPVIILTAKGTEYDKVLGLESGADDYLVKPFGMMELIARTKALLRRTAPERGGATQDKFTLGNLCVDIPEHKVIVGNAEITLTLKEFDLLVYLLKNESIVFSRERLLKNVWGFSYAGETRTVDTHILTLRGKLGTAGEYIKTVRGLGYKIGANE
jgi:two-component system alkaline phosphatase synthesis response regulator PhoP